MSPRVAAKIMNPVSAIWGKSSPQIALSGSILSRAYFAELSSRIEPSS